MPPAEALSDQKDRQKKLQEQQKLREKQQADKHALSIT